MVLWQGLAPVGVGVTLGLGAGYLVSRLVAGMLYGVRPGDPVSFIGAPVVLVVSALIACILPARRASGVDPVESLRQE